MLELHRGTLAFAMACLLACSRGGFADEAQRDPDGNTKHQETIRLELVLPRGSAQRETVDRLVQEVRELIERGSGEDSARTRGEDRPNTDQQAARKRHLAEAIEHLHAAGLHDVANQLRERAGQLLMSAREGSRSELANSVGTQPASAEMVKELHASIRGLQDQVRELGQLAESVDKAHRRIDELREHLDKRLTQARQSDGRNGQGDDRRIKLIEMLSQELKRRNDIVRALREEVLQKQKALARDGYATSSDGAWPGGSNHKSELANAPAAELRNALIDTQVELQFLKTSLQVAQELGQPESTISEARIDAMIENSPSVRELKSEIDETRAAIADIESTHKDPNSRDRYQRLKSDLAANEESLGQLRERLRADTQEQLRLQDQLAHDTTIRDLEMQIRAKEVTRKHLEKQVEEALRKRGISGEQVLAFEFARARLERENKIYEHIASRISELHSELDANPNRGGGPTKSGVKHGKGCSDSTSPNCRL